MKATLIVFVCVWLMCGLLANLLFEPYRLNRQMIAYGAVSLKQAW
jgi:hypothetical protein